MAENEVIWKHKMTRAEVPQNWFYVPTKLKGTFPPNGSVLVRVRGKTVKLKVNGYGYMSPDSMLSTTFYRLLGFDKERDTFVFSRNRRGQIELTVEKGGNTSGDSTS